MRVPSNWKGGFVFISCPSGAPDFSSGCGALLAKAPEKRKYAGEDVQWKVQEMHGLQEMQKMQESA